MNAEVHFPEQSPVSTQWNASTWRAFLRLRFAPRERGIRLVEAAHEGPLYVQKAFYPEGADCAHVYILHPPGGLVTGDHLAISIAVEPKAHALLTTPGAGRVYKAREQGGVQTQEVLLRVENDACLEWFPLETILFPNAFAKLNTRIELAAGAKMIAWDVTCFGLPANACAFDQGKIEQHLQITQQGRLKLNERLVVDPQAVSFAPSVLQGNAGFRGHPVQGLLVAGPFDSAMQDDLLEQLRVLQAPERQQQAWVGVTLVGEFLTVRYLGACTEAARLYFIAAWQLIRPCLIQKTAALPRIWAT